MLGRNFRLAPCISAHARHAVFPAAGEAVRLPGLRRTWEDAVLVPMPGMLLTRELFHRINLQDALGVKAVDEDLGEHVVRHSSSPTEAARAVITGLDANHRGAAAVLVGHSYGGYVALDMARHFPRRVAGIVLIATQCRGDTAGASLRRQKMVSFAREAGVERLLEKLLPSLLSGWAQRDEAIVQAVRKMAHAVGVDGFARQMAACMQRGDQRGTLAGLPAHVPALAVGGGCDGLVPPRTLVEMRSLLQEREAALATKSVFEPAQLAPWQVSSHGRCGHLVPLEQPGMLGDAIAEWAEAARTHAANTSMTPSSCRARITDAEGQCASFPTAAVPPKSTTSMTATLSRQAASAAGGRMVAAAAAAISVACPA